MALETLEQNSTVENAGPATSGVSDASAEMLARVTPGVVEVRSRGRGVGAGIIWEANGRIMTNHHVVVGTGGRPQVYLTDGRRFDTTLIAENPQLDLALLEVKATHLPALPIGDSSRLRVGELVFALGHPWGQRGVATAGIVSGLGTVRGDRSGRSADYIRSDVSLAPGNSGGPLLNARGQVVGINSMIFGGDLSVAVPSHIALSWLSTVGERTYLGVGVRPVRINAPGQDHVPTAGVLVIRLDPQGPARKAGIQAGDVVLSVAEQKVVDTTSLRKALSQGIAGGKATVAIIRDGKLQHLDVAFEAAA
jgi:serine protease Do